MDIVLGVSMTPTTVRMVLVEGEKADGVTVDHDVFDITSDHTSATAPEQVVAAILGTRESATEGGHRLVSTGVTWRDHDDAARLREALAAHDIDDVMLVSELHAAGALAQAVGSAVGYQRTALMFLDGDTATLSVVETSDGSIVRVERQDLHSDDAVAQLTSMVAALERLDAPPQGVFVVGSGVDVAALKLQLESATSLPVNAPDEPELALARGASLASVRAPLFEASTVARAYAQDGDEGPTAGADYAAGYAAAPAALAYSEVEPDDEPDFAVVPAAADAAVARQERKPFLLVGSAVTGIFVLGVAALVISLAVSIRPTVDQRPSPAESVIVPTQAPAPAAAVPAAPAAPAPPAAPLETIQAPIPVVQEAPQPQAPAPRTVFVEQPVAPAPAAPAPAAPPPAPAPAAPAPAPVAPPVIAPVVPAPILVPRLPVIRWPWERQNQYPQNPPQQWPQQPQNPWYPPPQQKPPQWDPPQSDNPPWEPPKQQKPPTWDPPESDDSPSWNPPQQQWPQQSGSGRGSDSHDDGQGGGSGGGRGSNDGGDTVWPWPNWGN